MHIVVDHPLVDTSLPSPESYPEPRHIWWLIFIIWLLHRLQMPPLFPLGPPHPDTNIISIYTQPVWCSACSPVCSAEVKVSRSRAMCRSDGRYRPAGIPRSLAAHRDPQLVNTRLILQSQQGRATCSQYTITSGDLIWYGEARRDPEEDFQCQHVKAEHCSKKLQTPSRRRGRVRFYSYLLFKDKGCLFFMLWCCFCIALRLKLMNSFLE